MTAQALDSNSITTIGVGVIIALVVLGILLSLLVTAVVGRLIILVVVVVLAVLVWQQRTSLRDKIDKCQLNATFFGVHVSAPHDVVQKCVQRGR
jgi:protein-S-isoprenylcysteine O-methyltransferase Ste14